MKNWYKTDTKKILDEFGVDKTEGLTSDQAHQAQRKYGLNQLESAKKINPLALFVSQFKDVLIIILIIAATVSLGLGLFESESEGVQEAGLIFFIVIAIALVGFFNEYKAEKTVEALKKLVGFKATVRRDGKNIQVDAKDIVPGDIVVLDAGQKLPADMRLIEGNELQVDEASLTGESLPVSKSEDTINKDASLGDQKNMLFSGTNITNGSGLGVVVATGSQTELGKIAKLVEDVEEETTPMQHKLDALGKKLGIIIAGICVMVFVALFILVPDAQNDGTVHRLIFAFTAAVALAVAAIPEGLAFVVRISLALGARRMATKKALVRKLSAVEALGSTDVICSDKTGTLTKGEMTVRNVYLAGQKGDVSGSGYEANGSITFSEAKHTPKGLEKLLAIGYICNNASIQKGKVIGDPTEAALLVSAQKEKIKGLSSFKKIFEIPFSSERKNMSTIHSLTTKINVFTSKKNDMYVVANKGALEVTLAKCSKYIDAEGNEKSLTSKVKDEIFEANRKMASEALRVLAFAFKTTAAKPTKKDAEKNLVFVGLQAMMDPPRKEVAQVVNKVQDEAGVRVIMITGDYIETAKAVAKEIGIGGDAISGVELDKLTQKEFNKRVQEINTYARVNPEHKIRIVKALKAHGHQVAMTGDGVNDAPAIKAADIGIAMGITGTDVTKEAADLILLDDQFLTIVNAIEEGRGIFDNVRKFVNFLISCNIAEVITILAGILIFNDLVLTAAQILFINIVTDGLPAVALGSDPAQKNILKHKPQRFQEKILNNRVWAEIFIFGIMMSVFLIGQYWYNLENYSHIAAVSAVFTAMVVYEMVRLIDIRTDYHIRWFSNPWLSIAIASSLLLQLAVLYVPVLAEYFEVQPLVIDDWSIMLIGSGFLFIFMKMMNPLLNVLIKGAETG